MSNRWSRIEAALSDEISNDSLRGRSVCCIAVCVSAWCQLSSVCLPDASWALTLATVSIWLSTGACCVPVTTSGSHRAYILYVRQLAQARQAARNSAA